MRTRAFFHRRLPVVQLPLLCGTLVILALAPARADDGPRVANTPPAAAAPAAKTASAAPVPSLDKLTAFIDAQVDAKIAERKLQPAPRADDAAFLRRVTLDLTGRIPSADEAVAFLKDHDPKKREKKIDALLACPEWAEQWAEVWTTLLMGRLNKGREYAARQPVHAWLRDAFAKNMPYDALVRALLTVRGRSDENPAVFYLLRFRDSPPDAVGHVVRTFCGVRIQCAQCHNHPYEKWKQEDFWSVAAFLTRTKVRTVEKPEKGPPIVELVDLPRGEISIPDTKPAKGVAPKFITGEEPAAKAGRRDELARILTAPANPYFAKAFVNRAWYECFGRGLVDPVDDFRASDPGSHPELLEAMAQAFVAGGYDMKALLRAILNTRAYQRASHLAAEGQDDEAYYTHALLRVMSPEALFESLIRSTGSNALAGGRGAEASTTAMPQAMAPADAAPAMARPPDAAARFKEQILRRFVFLFANDEMQEVTDFEGTIPQALLLLNGAITNGGAGGRQGAMPRANAKAPAANRKAADRGIQGRPALPMLGDLLRAYEDPDARLDRLFLSILCRTPQPAERSRYRTYLQQRQDDREAYEDVAWTLLNSTEFMYNH